MSLPDLAGVCLLYLLLGCGVSAAVLPKSLEQLDPADRNTLTTMPLLRAGLWVLCVVCWPVLLIGRGLRLGRWGK